MMDSNEFKILVIDDNLEIHKDFIKILSNSNASYTKLTALNKELFGEKKQEVFLSKFQIDTAIQGEEGLEKILNGIKQNKPYALAFVDVRMPPGWDGIETIQHIWQLDKDIQIVICTAYSDYSWEETVEKLGQSDNLLILKKPFDQIAIRQLACALTKKWKLMQDARQYTHSLEVRIQERTHSLQHSLSITRATLESSADAILVVDNEGKVTDFNDKFILMCNVSREVIFKTNIYFLIDQITNQLANPKSFMDKLSKLHIQASQVDSNFIHFKDGRVFEYYTQPHKLGQEIIGRVWSFRDITPQARLEEELKFQATHDSLTKLPNRVLLIDRIQQAIHNSKRNNSQFAVLFFDLDRFKLINDSLNHSAGDLLLSTIADRLKKTIRENDTLARIGGDEFVLIVSDLEKQEALLEIITRAMDAINQSVDINNHNIMTTSSIGIALFPKDGQRVDELLRNADTAMYFAKGSGANQFKFYNEIMNKQNADRLERITSLRSALVNKELFLLYQPQIDVKTKKLVAVEALVRWNHPKNGTILPMDFIPIAEDDSTLAVAIGEWVLREACKQNKAWQDAGFQPIRIAVNITSQQLRQLNLVSLVKEILQETELNPEYLELELTENTIINNDYVVKTIKALKELGVHIALDDFGTGYLNINYLRKASLDRLKIDSSFVKNIEIARSDKAIIQAIISLARSLNLQVLAEGVETENQLNFLKEHNIDEIQGFFYSQPVSSEEMKKIFNGESTIEQILLKQV